MTRMTYLRYDANKIRLGSGLLPHSPIFPIRLHSRHLLLLIFMLLIAVSAEAQYSVFKPFTFFRVIQTEHFDIIFPKESESSARLLASYADRAYQQVSSLLGIDVPRRIPVTFTPHTDLFNGFYSTFGYSIMLFDTPMDIEWTSFANSLEGLFIHELTHAVSLNTRNRSLRGLHRIFGNWVTPALITAPMFMVEGVTVSFESLPSENGRGFGRANDPLVKQSVRQAVFEGSIPTPFQASGVYDLPAQGGGIYYEYGGLFSAWLQQTFGMEKYAELWQSMGMDKGAGFSLNVYKSGFYRIFMRVYNIEFLDAWDAFCDSLAIDGLEENFSAIRPYEFSSINNMTSGGSEIFIIDGTKIRIYNTQNGKSRTLHTDTFYSNDIDVNAEKGTILLSGFAAMGDRYRAVVTEHRINNGRKTGRKINGLFSARYFRDGIIGLRSDLHNNNIVYENFNGLSEILFRGNEELLFSGPQAVDNERIAFIAACNGIRELWLYNYVSGELFRIEDSEGETDNWRYMRGLGVSQGKLFFSHNDNDRMYKLAVVNLDTMDAVFSQRDFSGGVFNPVSVDNVVYYRGAFSERDSLLRFPENAGNVSGKYFELRLTQLDNQHYRPPAHAETAPPYAGPSKPFTGFSYMNPLYLWVPVPLFRTNESANGALSLDGGGLLSIIYDPTGTNLVEIMAYADIPYQMAAVEYFTWNNTGLGFPLTANFSDMVLDSGGELYRDTRVNVTGGYNWSMGRWYTGASIGGMYARKANYEEGKNAYLWEETNNDYAISAAFSISNLRRYPYEIFGTGLSLSLLGTSIFESFSPRIMARFHANMETRFPLSLTLFGAYDRLGMDLHGVSFPYGDPLFAGYASTEYAHPGDHLLYWLGGAEAAIGLFTLEIQRNFSHIYFNRLYGTLALRNTVYDGKGIEEAEGIAIQDIRLVQSLVFKANLVFSAIPLKMSPFFVEPYIWGAWKFSNTINNREKSQWYMDFGLILRL